MLACFGKKLNKRLTQKEGEGRGIQILSKIRSQAWEIHQRYAHSKSYMK